MSTEHPYPEAADPAAPSAEAPDMQETPAESPEQMMRAAAERLVSLQTERDEMREKWMRSEAEMANLRARTKREVDETRQYAVQKFARDVAEAADNIRRGLDSLPHAAHGEPEIVGKLREGFAGVERSVIALLERNGVKREDPTGAMFDPNLHQAMAEQESMDHPPGTILQAWTPAWTLNGRLLRPAMVVVAKAHPGELAAPTRVDTTA